MSKYWHQIKTYMACTQESPRIPVHIRCIFYHKLYLSQCHIHIGHSPHYKSCLRPRYHDNHKLKWIRIPFTVLHEILLGNWQLQHCIFLHELTQTSISIESVRSDCASITFSSRDIGLARALATVFITNTWIRTGTVAFAAFGKAPLKRKHRHRF